MERRRAEEVRAENLRAGSPRKKLNLKQKACLGGWAGLWVGSGHVGCGWGVICGGWVCGGRSRDVGWRGVCVCAGARVACVLWSCVCRQAWAASRANPASTTYYP
jgi:hypothetical protein